MVELGREREARGGENERGRKREGEERGENDRVRKREESDGGEEWGRM